ncbi:hypothetical protein [Streptosporangium saharense]|uniref:hypothetical protein n=1 Tax=Streptosporangium saharense TaxID=1706840 RepID=UPI0036A7C66E
MKILGFYEELWSARAGSPLGSIKNFVRNTAAPDEEKVMNYLANGHEIFSVMGVEKDVLGSDYRILGGYSVKTDGEWVWRDGLWFYLIEYHIGLPEEFLEKVRAYNYEVPYVPESLLDELADKVVDIW